MEVTTGKTALVIDDDPFIAELLQVLLETRNFTVDVARDGIDAVDLKRRYDVILLDMKMPVFDGERLAGYWMLTQPDVLERVIVLTGYSRFAETRKLPTFASIGKPFDHEALLRVVDECVSRQQEK